MTDLKLGLETGRGRMLGDYGVLLLSAHTEHSSSIRSQTVWPAGVTVLALASAQSWTTGARSNLTKNNGN